MEDFDLVPSFHDFDPRVCNDILVRLELVSRVRHKVHVTVCAFDDARADGTLDELAPLCRSSTRMKLTYWETRFASFFGVTSGKRGGYVRRMRCDECDVCEVGTTEAPRVSGRAEGEPEMPWRGHGPHLGSSQPIEQSDEETEGQLEEGEIEGDIAGGEGYIEDHTRIETPIHGTGGHPIQQVDETNEEKHPDVEVRTNWSNKLRLGRTIGHIDRIRTFTQRNTNILRVLDANDAGMREFAKSDYVDDNHSFFRPAVREEIVIVKSTETEDRHLATVRPVFPDSTKRARSIALHLHIQIPCETVEDIRKRSVLVSLAVQDALHRIKMELAQDST